MKLYLEIETDYCLNCDVFNYDLARCEVTQEEVKGKTLLVRLKKCPLKTKEQLLKKWKVAQ